MPIAATHERPSVQVVRARDNSTTIGLHSPESAALASLLGGPMAGAIVIAANCLKLNERLNALMSLFLGVFATTALSLAFISYSVHVGAVALIVVMSAGLSRSVAWTLFSESIDDDTDDGVGLRSRWIGVGIGLLFLIAKAAVLAVVL